MIAFACHLAMIARVLSMNMQSSFFILASNRAAIRLVSCFLFLDLRKSAVCSVFTSAAISWAYLSNYNVFREGTLHRDHAWHFVVNECGVCCGLLMVCALL